MTSNADPSATASAGPRRDPSHRRSPRQATQAPLPGPVTLQDMLRPKLGAARSRAGSGDPTSPMSPTRAAFTSVTSDVRNGLQQLQTQLRQRAAAGDQPSPSVARERVAKQAQERIQQLGQKLSKFNPATLIDKMESDQNLADQLEEINEHWQQDKKFRDIKREAEEACMRQITDHLRDFLRRHGCQEVVVGGGCGETAAASTTTTSSSNRTSSSSSSSTSFSRIYDDDDDDNKDNDNEDNGSLEESLPSTEPTADPSQYPTYEQWIEDLHPENAHDSKLLEGMDKEIDSRFYVSGSDHLQLWNQTVPQHRRVEPRDTMYRKEFGPSESVDLLEPPTAEEMTEMNADIETVLFAPEAEQQQTQGQSEHQQTPLFSPKTTQDLISFD